MPRSRSRICVPGEIAPVQGVSLFKYASVVIPGFLRACHYCSFPFRYTKSKSCGTKYRRSIYSNPVYSRHFRPDLPIYLIQ